ncbi:D-alanine--D-alanine ligase family protein [Lacticaseibacillus songhuajiangensis]|uniref:D-alanine--D-alanine ligase family protein n=1 Tax=Lacticaseibacillus songhuajiangensis TaxID=1296539 RepID=UPI000F780E11|nr:D-alanine--D-alanine ligase [Lacticaseibacillus songhuajiangensis]
MKICVLAGGRSTERNVSLSSGTRITTALRAKGHQATLIDLFLGYDLAGKTADDAFADANIPDSMAISDAVLTDDDINALRKDGSTQLFGPNVLAIAQAADIVYLALHGGDGENGKVQAYLDLNNIRYTGSGALASGMTMNKVISKKIMLQSGIPTAGFKEVMRQDGIHQTMPFGFPMIVKPTSGGSSVGMTIAHNQDELEAGLTEAFRFDPSAIVEEFITGREFSLGVVNGHALPAIEIKVHDGWYDFEHKFQPGHTDFVTPPELDEDVHKRMQDIAVQTLDALELQNYARVDFLLDKDNGIWVIEANNLPGMTPLSLLPQEAEADGTSYEDLVDGIVKGKIALYEQGLAN